MSDAGRVPQEFPRQAMDAETELARLRSVGNAAFGLKSGGGSGTSGGMEALIDAKVAAAEARTDAKFAAVLAKLDSLTVEVRSTRGSVWQGVFAVMGLIVALVAILGTVVPFSFTAGSQYRDIAREEVRVAEAQRAPAAAPVVVAPAPNAK